MIHPEKNPDTVSTLSQAEKDLCRDIRALSDVELLEFLSDLRKMEREQAAQRIEACRTDLRGYIDKSEATSALRGEQA